MASVLFANKIQTSANIITMYGLERQIILHFIRNVKRTVVKKRNHQSHKL